MLPAYSWCLGFLGAASLPSRSCRSCRIAVHCTVCEMSFTECAAPQFEHHTELFDIQVKHSILVVFYWVLSRVIAHKLPAFPGASHMAYSNPLPTHLEQCYKVYLPILILSETFRSFELVCHPPDSISVRRSLSLYISNSQYPIKTPLKTTF